MRPRLDPPLSLITLSDPCKFNWISTVLDLAFCQSHGVLVNKVSTMDFAFHQQLRVLSKSEVLGFLGTRFRCKPVILGILCLPPSGVCYFSSLPDGKVAIKFSATDEKLPLCVRREEK